MTRDGEGEREDKGERAEAQKREEERRRRAKEEDDDDEKRRGYAIKRR